jgi:hypothetical protein
MRIIVGNNDRGASVLLQDGENVLLLAQKSSLKIKPQPASG